MATESVTTAIEFEKAPVYPCGLFQVNAGVPATFAISLAQIIMDYVRERLTDAVESPMDADEAFVLKFLLATVGALYSASGAEA